MSLKRLTENGCGLNSLSELFVCGPKWAWNEMTKWLQNRIHWWQTFPPKNYLGGQLSYKNGFNINYLLIIYLFLSCHLRPLSLRFAESSRQQQHLRSFSCWCGSGVRSCNWQHSGLEKFFSALPAAGGWPLVEADDESEDETKQVCLTLGWSSVVFALCLLIEKKAYSL